MNIQKVFTLVDFRGFESLLRVSETSSDRVVSTSRRLVCDSETVDGELVPRPRLIFLRFVHPTCIRCSMDYEVETVYLCQTGYFVQSTLILWTKVSNSPV